MSLSSHALDRISYPLISALLTGILSIVPLALPLACWETRHQRYLISLAVMVPIGNHQAGITAFTPVSRASFRRVKAWVTYPCLRRCWQISMAARLKARLRNAANPCITYNPSGFQAASWLAWPRSNSNSLCPTLNFQIFYFCINFQIFLPM